ncbi:MAG: hypothetical protein K8R73_03405, partial [Clostridiales bacterium]|nr:hypothetical protein [Clostridiales bacterium]
MEFLSIVSRKVQGKQGMQGEQEKIKVKCRYKHRRRSRSNARSKQLGTGPNWYLVFCNGWFIMIMCFEYRNFMEAICAEDR